MNRPRVLIVGACFAGFHCARELARLLRLDEAELTLASPVDYLPYSPLLPQVAASVITPQAAAVSLRRTLRRTLRAPCSVTGIDLDAPHVLPGLGGKLSAAALGRLRQRGVDVRLGTGISEITASAVRLTDGAELPCHTLVWTAGVMASLLIGTLGPETARSGRLRVTPELQVPGRPGVFGAGDAAAVPDLTRDPEAVTAPTAQHTQRQGATVARNIARRLRGQPLQPYRHRDLGLAVDLGGTQAVAGPLGRQLIGVPAQVATRGYHLYRLPSLRARVRTAADWLTHATLGDDFTRLVPPDPMRGTLADREPAGQYLSGDDARQTAAAILAHGQGGWPA